LSGVAWGAAYLFFSRSVVPKLYRRGIASVAGLAAALLLTTRVSTSRQPRFPGANAAVRFARISAGLAKYRSNWIESIVR
jgi:hypothetical protein